MRLWVKRRRADLQMCADVMVRVSLELGLGLGSGLGCHICTFADLHIRITTHGHAVENDPTEFDLVFRVGADSSGQKEPCTYQTGVQIPTHRKGTVTRPSSN